MKKPYIIFTLLFVSIVFLFASNKPSQHKKSELFSNHGVLNASNELTSNQGSQNELEHSILMAAYKRKNIV
jgi:hypothetical protein